MKCFWFAPLVVLGLVACNRSESASAPSPAAASAKGSAVGSSAPVVSVATVIAERRDVPVQLQANATVQALSNVELHPQVANTVAKVQVAEGQFVKRGQVLMTLDDRAERANLDKARAQLARDQATMVDLQRQYQRSLDLVAKKFVTQSNADSLSSQVDAQRATIAADQAGVAAAELALGFDVIHAPLDGRVGEIKVFPGTLVQASTALLTVTQMQPVAMSFTVPESELAAVLAAQKAGVVKVHAKMSPKAGSVPDGILSFIDSGVDSQSGVIKLKAQFDNHDLAWWPGQYQDVQLTVKTLKGAVVVPQAAVVTSVKGTFVYQIANDSTARVVPVKVLYQFGTDAALAGLQGGEKIIVEGKQNLRPGGKVREAGPDAKKAGGA